MAARDQRIYEEAAALWRELHGGSDPSATDGEAILNLITRELPPVGYERICSPYLRPSTITGPKRRPAEG